MTAKEQIKQHQEFQLQVLYELSFGIIIRKELLKMYHQHSQLFGTYLKVHGLSGIEYDIDLTID